MFSAPYKTITHPHCECGERSQLRPWPSRSQPSVTQPRSDDGLSRLWWSSCFTRLQKTEKTGTRERCGAKWLYIFNALPWGWWQQASTPSHCALTWPRCLPAADVSDAAPGASRALTWAARSHVASQTSQRFQAGNGRNVSRCADVHQSWEKAQRFASHWASRAAPDHTSNRCSLAAQCGRLRLVNRPWKKKKKSFACWI